MTHGIDWPEGFAPGTTDNFISEELVVPALSAAGVWPHLVDTAQWISYYGYMSEVAVADGGGLLRLGTRFRLSTLSYAVDAEVTQYREPSRGIPGLLAWRGRVEEATGRLDLYHGWRVEDLAGGGVRILTQETQTGELAREIAKADPSPMLYAHQDWVKGLASTALRAMEG